MKVKGAGVHKWGLTLEIAFLIFLTNIVVLIFLYRGMFYPNSANRALTPVRDLPKWVQKTPAPRHSTAIRRFTYIA